MPTQHNCKICEENDRDTDMKAAMLAREEAAEAARETALNEAEEKYFQALMPRILDALTEATKDAAYNEEHNVTRWQWDSAQDEALSNAERQAREHIAMGGSLQNDGTFIAAYPSNAGPKNGRVGGNGLGVYPQATENSSRVEMAGTVAIERKYDEGGASAFANNGLVGGRVYKERLKAAKAENDRIAAQNFSLGPEPIRHSPLEPVLESPDSLIARGRGSKGGAELPMYEYPDEMRDPAGFRLATSHETAVYGTYGEGSEKKLEKQIIRELRRLRRGG